MDFPGGSVTKNPPTNAGNVSLIPGSGISLGEENGNPVQNSCLGNPMDSGTWWATVHGVAKESNTAWWLNKNNNNDVSISVPPTRFVPPSPSPFCIHVHSLCLGLWSCLQIGLSAPFPRFQTYVLVDNILYSLLFIVGFPGGASGKEPACQYRRHKRLGFEREKQISPSFWSKPSPRKRNAKSQNGWLRRPYK